MRTKLWLVAALLIGLTGAAFASQRDQAKAQVEFGLNVAQKGLWTTAVNHWEKAVELEPTYAAAWNNLAVGYEQLGRFDDALKAYQKAVDLEPNNNYIRNNFDLFREIYDRQNRARRR
jgi:Flp pilus assembly protein TadD